MIIVKKTKIEKLAEMLAEEAKEYNKAREEFKSEKRPIAAIRAWERISGIMLAAEVFGINTSLIWNSAGDRIWMVKAGWQSVRIPQKGENDEA